MKVFEKEKHDFAIELGVAIYELVDSSLFLCFPEHGIRVYVASGIDAHRRYTEIKYKEENRAFYITHLAAEVCGTDPMEMKQKIRTENVVFARYLAMWYMVTEMDMSYRLAGAYFTRDHATAIHGKKIIDNKDQFLSPQQRKWKSVFFSVAEYKNLLQRNTLKKDTF